MGMPQEMWLPTLLVVAIADAVIVVIGLAMFTDGRLLGERRRWRFGLTTLMVATAWIAVHMAIVVNVLFGRAN
jgi:hypothetical protein